MTIAGHGLGAGAFRILPVLALVAGLFAGPAAAHEPGKPDFTGMWLGSESILKNEPVNGHVGTGFPDDPPLTEAGKKALEAYNPKVDDPPEDCLPWGFPRNVVFTFYPRQIVQLEDKILIVNEYDPIPRRIYMDGRDMPEDIQPLWYGYSIGHWEGDTLVVKTRHMREENILTTSGLPQSAEMRVTERFRLLDDGETMEVKVRIVDPKYYTEPLNLIVYWARTDREQQEFVCVEGLQDNITELDQD